MGDFKESQELGSVDETYRKRSQLIIILMILIAFFAPAAMAGEHYFSSFYLNITAMTWQVNVSQFGLTIQFLEPYMLLTMSPFLLFRAGFVYQISKYYRGKTTRGRTAIAAVLSEAPFFVLFFFWAISTALYSGFGLNSPLPIMMVVGLLILWRFPMPTVKVPWEGAEEPTPWWEEESKEDTKPAVDK